MKPNNNQERPSLGILLRTLRLPSFVNLHEEVAETAEKQGWSFAQYLGYLVEQETEDRRLRRIDRLLKKSGLIPDKTLATLKANRLPVKVRRQLPTLCEGGFASRAENLLAFGLPGRGKTHVVNAIGHELIRRGISVLFRPTYVIVQELLRAKRDLLLERAMKRLDRYEVIVLDDLGYVQQDREEMEVLFTLLSERYERKSVIITSNLVFSQWDQIFKDPLTTQAAIDRVVHHSTILELTGTSFRADSAKRRTPRKKNGKNNAEGAE